MKLYSSDENYKLYYGNMLDLSEVIEPNSVDAIVTDPPYELNFMNKGWDNSGIAFQKETWKKCYDALKSGGHMLVFGGSRTFHRIACAIEDAGFEIRDTIMWIYGSGFPKSMNIGLAIDKRNGVESKIGGVKQGHEDFVGRKTNGHMNFEDGMKGFDRPWMHDEEKRESYHYQKIPTSDLAKQWEGWGTQLKPSYEPIIIARKPCEGSIVDNVMKYGVGGINIDECRIETSDMNMRGGATSNGNLGWKPSTKEYNDGRFPANTILTYDDSDFDEVCGGFPNTKSSGGSGDKSINGNFKNVYGDYKGGVKPSHLGGLGDEGSASRYFYCAKASKRDRDEGCELLEDKYLAMSNQAKAELKRENFSFQGNKESPLNSFNKVQVGKNIHPTVKPTSLMQYLVRLVTPKGGTVLDPFNGSGSTGKACMYENADRKADYKYIGIELTEEYLPIAKARIEFAEKNPIMDYEIKKTKTETNKTDDDKSKSIFEI